MSTTLNRAPAVRITRGATRPAALCGVVFAVMLFVAVASVNIPRGATDDEMLAWWASNDNRTADVVSTFALLAAGLTFLVFLSELVRRLSAGRTEAESGLAPRLAQQAGTVFVAMIFAAGLGGAVVRGLVVDDEPLPGVDVLRYFAQLRYTAMGAFAMPAAAVVIGATAYLVLRDGVLPRWIGWLSVLCTIAIVVASALFVGQFAIPALLVWAIACSVTLLRSPTSRTMDSPA